MKHVLTLSDNDGVILCRWVIEEDFGDIERPIRAHMADCIFDEWQADNDANKPEG